MEDNLVVLFIHGLIMFMFLGIAHLIVRNGYYGLISGFNRRPKEEQEELIKRGFPQAMGMVLLAGGIVLAIGFVLVLFNVSYAFEGSLGVMLLIVLGGMIYVQKYELPHKKKKGYIISTVTTLLTITVAAVALASGFVDNDLKIESDYVEVTGFYGVEWDINSIERVELLEELPKVLIRTNGYSFAGRLKGNFRLEDLGKGKLFINSDQGPYLLVVKGEDYFIINQEDETKTKQWFAELERHIK
ncbi:DUF3784 domain-containing protein [Ornithinibacillus halophilus]|uniref:PH domain-containing protein n=1 Tax=Ornithinibacillus halophilus TaxID=930117 RepID=A0A1M5ID36_9BACI|nr:DUF3784 domain-containing protein [Ornithinibacillus halophilus]SHG26274.1 protein of unknown function [Ornithinibacillus halophilus]